MTTHATVGDLSTDTCHHIGGPCGLGCLEACDDLFNLPNGITVACQSDVKPIQPIDWDDVEHWGGRVHNAITDDLGHGKGSEGVSDQ